VAGSETQQKPRKHRTQALSSEEHARRKREAQARKRRKNTNFQVAPSQTLFAGIADDRHKQRPGLSEEPRMRTGLLSAIMLFACCYIVVRTAFRLLALLLVGSYEVFRCCEQPFVYLLQVLLPI
jgi:hypothetical protein